MNQEYSMDNPPIITFPHLEEGDVFVYKGHRCKVTTKHYNGFEYDIEHPNHEHVVKGYMTYGFYMSTPSAKGRGL